MRNRLPPPPDNVVPFRKPPRRDGSRPPFRLPSWLNKPWLWRTVTGRLILANLAIYVAMVVTSFGSGIFGSFPLSVTIAWGSMDPALVPREPWRILTAIFLHGGLMHVVMNMLILWFLGTRLEGAFGKGRFLALYLGAGLLGEIVSFVWHLQVGGTSVGASGAILGVLGALFMLSWRAAGWDSPLTKTWLYWTVGSIVVGLLIGSGRGAPVDNAAHIGGWLGGAGLAHLFFLGRPGWAPARDRAFGIAGTVAVVASFVLALVVGSRESSGIVHKDLRGVVAAARSNDPVLLEKELASAIDKHPDEVGLRVQRADVLLALGRKDEALVELRHAMRGESLLGSLPSRTLLQLAVLFERAGAHDEALTAAKTAKVRAPSDPDVDAVYRAVKDGTITERETQPETTPASSPEPGLQPSPQESPPEEAEPAPEASPR